MWSFPFQMGSPCFVKRIFDPLNHVNIALISCGNFPYMVIIFHIGSPCFVKFRLKFLNYGTSYRCIAYVFLMWSSFEVTREVMTRVFIIYSRISLNKHPPSNKFPFWIELPIKLVPDTPSVV